MAAGETRTGTLSPTGSGSYSPSPHEGDDDDEEERDGAEEEEEAEDSSDSVGCQWFTVWYLFAWSTGLSQHTNSILFTPANYLLLCV